jgi:hypothetical protein
MVWWTEALEIRGDVGDGHSGRWRLTASSDEGGGGPCGDESPDHASIEEANSCEKRDDYVSRIAGFPSRRARAEEVENREREELIGLKSKYGE